MDKPLQGIRVLELATYVAGPVCARLLGDLGADVIKVEALSGDAWRLTGKSYNARFSDDENPVFDIYNSGKRCISLNLKDPAGMEAFHKLLAQTDVFVTNTRPKSLRKLGIYYDDIKDRYPNLIYGILLGYGEEGPDKDLPAFDVTAFWARGGFLADTGEAGEHYTPTMAPFGVGDSVTGSMLFGEICAALFRRERTGKGDFVRAGLYHNAIFTMGTMEIIAQKPFGTKYPRTSLDAGMQGHYRCSDDEWVYLATGNALVTLSRVGQIIGKPELGSDPRFQTPAGRAANRQELHALLAEGFIKQPADYWRQKAKEMDLPMVKLTHFSDVTTDEQAWANGYLEQVTFRNGSQLPMPRSPLSMDSLGVVDTKCAPLLGTNTREVLAEVGYGEQEIEQMKQAGAIGTCD